MLRVFNIEQGSLAEQEQGPEGHLLSARGVWVDTHEPTDEERELLQQFLRTELPESDDVEEIESSARYFVDAAGIHVHSLFLAQSEGRHHTVTTAFILQKDRLFTLREEELADFRLLRMRARRGQVEVHSPRELMVEIFDQKVENLADQLEDIHTKLETVSHLVLEDEDASLEDAIDQLAKLEDSNGKIRLCLMDTKRSVSYLMRHLRSDQEMQENARIIMKDVDTLMSHNTFLFDKINFLMDSTQGFINIEQNQIIKIFSIAAVTFLPPTLVASIYGMNFQLMPELNWQLGYPFALGLMVISGISPYLYFKRKGWL
ncbi:magnesium/cobalt transporter CorA [Motiliproteus sediminis]|uniref:magnesium/cobalt transporter CorA n=1 Tax=Motiliproteus sediminis TaxID=1468178 RepID=UPI001AEFAAE9|nr:magnesium/cobalt transporter CorA [Motiliproteus sediminis]